MGKVIIVLGALVVGAAIGYAVYASLSEEDMDRFLDVEYPSNI